MSYPFEIDNDLSDWATQWNCNQAGHRLSALNSLPSESDHCGQIVSQHDSVLSSCPFQNGRVIGAKKVRVLDSDEVDWPKSSGQTRDDFAIEILVREKSHQAISRA